jgi:NTE family protein
MRRTAAASAILALGHPPVFTPRVLPGAHWLASPSASASLYDTAPLGGTIERLVDLDLLNRAPPRFAATAVDLESGEDVVFDTASAPVGIAHLLASSALLPAFPAVPIGGRLFCDPGLSSNLPMDIVLGEASSRPLLCITVDLLPLRAPPPGTLGEVTERAQDLMFATQSRRALAAWQAIFDEREAQGCARAVTLVQIVYEDQDDEVSGKAFDFSPETIRARWAAGYRDIERALAGIRAASVTLRKPGLHVYARHGCDDALQRVRSTLAPQSPSYQASFSSA